MARYKFDESKLKPGQKIAAMLLVEREFAPKEERRTKISIAAEAGVTPQGMNKWEREDANFVAYKNSLSATVMDAHLPLVYSKLLGIINQGNAKGIEMFLKRIGDLDTKQEVVITTGSDDMTFEERKAALEARLQTEKAAE